MTRTPLLVGMLLACCLIATAGRAAADPAVQVVRPKVVLLGYFETSRQYGEPGYWGEADRPGELFYWIKYMKLDRRLPVRGAFEQAWANEDASVIALKIGPNSLAPAVNVTALGLDEHFDLRHSYFLISGIAGTSPFAGTIGDVIWTDYVVNGGVAHEIDAREIPEDWPTGYVPAGRSTPYAAPRVTPGSADDVTTWGDGFRQNRARTVTQLNLPLMRWAEGMTRGQSLPESTAQLKLRRRYDAAAARATSGVGHGATLSSETFWLGQQFDQWARRWVRYMTDSRGTYRTTETNDAGTMVALAALDAAGRVDANRVLLLRGVSNFDMPPPDVSAAQQLRGDGDEYAGYLPALEGIYGVGSRVVKALLADWNRYETTPPAGRD